MIKTSSAVHLLVLLFALSGCGIGLQPVPSAVVPDDDDDDSVANDDDSGADDDDSVANDDDSLGDDDDSVGDDDDSLGDDDDSVGGDGPCSALTTITCGQQISDDTNGPGSTDQADTWSCSGWANTGPEMAYEFTPTSSGQVTASLSSIQTGEDLDIYVTADSGIGCHSGDCVDYGDNDVTFDAAAGITYFVVVDGYQDSAGSFVLDLECASVGDDDDATGDDDDSVGDDDDATGAVESCTNGFDDDGDGLADCDDPDCVADPACQAPVESCTNGFDDDGDGLADCDDPDCAADPACQGSGGGGACVPDWILTENSSDSWNNGGIGSTNNIALYSCIAWDESGPEYTYSYTATQTGTATVGVSVTGWFNFSDLDVFVLDGSTPSCDPLNCVAYGDTSASWAVTAGSTWYIVVDGFLGDTSDYDIDLTFSP